VKPGCRPARKNAVTLPKLDHATGRRPVEDCAQTEPWPADPRIEAEAELQSLRVEGVTFRAFSLSYVNDGKDRPWS